MKKNSLTNDNLTLFGILFMIGFIILLFGNLNQDFPMKRTANQIEMDLVNYLWGTDEFSILICYDLEAGKTWDPDNVVLKINDKELSLKMMELALQDQDSKLPSCTRLSFYATEISKSGQVELVIGKIMNDDENPCEIAQQRLNNAGYDWKISCTATGRSVEGVPENIGFQRGKDIFDEAFHDEVKGPWTFYFHAEQAEQSDAN